MLNQRYLVKVKDIMTLKRTPLILLSTGEDYVFRNIRRPKKRNNRKYLYETQYHI